MCRASPGRAHGKGVEFAVQVQEKHTAKNRCVPCKFQAERTAKNRSVPWCSSRDARQNNAHGKESESSLTSSANSAAHGKHPEHGKLALPYCVPKEHGKGSLPTRDRPCGLCRVVRHGTAFAVFRAVFAVRFGRTAKSSFPVVQLVARATRDTDNLVYCKSES